MTESERFQQQRVQAILLTGRDSVILIKRRDPGRDGMAAPFWSAPGGIVRADDKSDIAALRRVLHETLDVEVDVLDHALTLFMSRWNFYLCRLEKLSGPLHSRTRTDPDGGLYAPQEIPLTESALRQVNVRPRALLDYLLANLSKLRRM